MDLVTRLATPAHARGCAGQHPAVLPSNGHYQFAVMYGGASGLILLWEGFIDLLVSGQT